MVAGADVRHHEGSDKPLIVISGLPLTPGRIANENDVPPPRDKHSRVSEQRVMSLVEHGIRSMVVVGRPFWLAQSHCEEGPSGF